LEGLTSLAIEIGDTEDVDVTALGSTRRTQTDLARVESAGEGDGSGSEAEESKE